MNLANSSVPEITTFCLCSVLNMVAEDSADLHHLDHRRNSWNHPASKLAKTPQFLLVHTLLLFIWKKKCFELYLVLFLTQRHSHWWLLHVHDLESPWLTCSSMLGVNLDSNRDSSNLSQLLFFIFSDVMWEWITQPNSSILFDPQVSPWETRGTKDNTWARQIEGQKGQMAAQSWKKQNCTQTKQTHPCLLLFPNHSILKPVFHLPQRQPS